MATLLKTQSLSYQDVTLIAQLGAVESRKQIPIEGHRVVVAAMTSIICKEFIEEVAKLPELLQPTLHIPRDNYQYENMDCAISHGLKNIFVGVGLKENKDYENWIVKYYTTAFIDIANGYLPQIGERVKNLKEKGFKKVICGSIHSDMGVHYLKNCGVDILRTGIGTSSSICSTRFTTGFYRGQITEIMDCYKWAVGGDKAELLADGGFIYPGDYVKAFLAGADYCMGGKIFTECDKARLHVDGSGEYFGMSNPDKGISNSGFDESFTIKVEKKTKTLEEILTNLWMGILSGVSYSGYETLTEAIGNGVFEVVYNPDLLKPR